jgi:hypothetical protein
MRVVKMRGSDHATTPYRLRIELGGLKVEKLSREEFERARGNAII